MHRQNTSKIWTKYGQNMDKIWTKYGQNTDKTQTKYGQRQETKHDIKQDTPHIHTAHT